MTNFESNPTIRMISDVVGFIGIAAATIGILLLLFKLIFG